jgi:hypothetical protein
MKNDCKILIPLISFSSGQVRWELGIEKGEKIIISTNYTRISPPMELPDLCYGVRIERACDNPFLPLGCLAIFSKSKGTALGNIYAVEVQGEFPFVGKWMQKEISEGVAGSRRKVFMVPTPMHVPDSQFSPIASSLHHVLLFKDFSKPGKLRLIPANKIIWTHRLVYVQN